MNKQDQSWQRLVKTARTVPPAAAEAPTGFATRVVARWQSEPAPSLLPVWEWLATRALAVCCALMLISIGTGYTLFQEQSEDVTSFPDQMMQQVLEP